MAAKKSIVRCAWSEGVDPAYTRYHDEEWGVPVRDDDVHF
jgi:DNA-3-methyladenine glycosylase I